MILDGKAVAAGILKDIRVELLKENGRKPTLAILLIGDNPVSRRYVDRKRDRAAEIGIEARLMHFPAETSQANILAAIVDVNRDVGVDGMIVQMPLPAHINQHEIIAAIDPKKDVDGFHPLNLGRMFLDQEALTCATPTGVMRLLDYYQVPIEGKHAVVVGRSNIVGKPMAVLLINRGATVTSCNSRTPDLGSITRQADILITATGCAKGITTEMVKDGVAVVDVGQSFIGNELFGDVDFEDVAKKASFITPVPGGVGPMTIALLLENTYRAWKVR